VGSIPTALTKVKITQARFGKRNIDKLIGLGKNGATVASAAFSVRRGHLAFVTELIWGYVDD
jgi:hypothetical protein